MSSSAVDLIEALLFASEGPQTCADLARGLSVTEGQVEQALEVLGERYQERGGITLVKLAGGYELCTKPSFAEKIAAYLQQTKPRLGRSQLEVLAIVAYRQPVTSSEIEAVRGVQSDFTLRSLTERALIHEVGRKKSPGRPILYGTTQTFLHAIIEY